MPGRGQLTDAISDKAKAFLGRDLTQIELRLYPYLQYVMVNERKLDPRRVNPEERVILAGLRTEGHIEGGAGGLTMTREFFLFISDLIFDAYAAFDNFPGNRMKLVDAALAKGVLREQCRAFLAVVLKKEWRDWVRPKIETRAAAAAS